MESSLGRSLRQLRNGRRLSLEAAARRAGIARSTLNRWELGVHEPRRQELDAVLSALEATAQQRAQVMALLGGKWVYSAGDAAVLRTLRRRRGLALGQVAACLGVWASTVSRWEQGRTTPPADRLHALLEVLGAPL